MRHAIFSDIHNHTPALQAVLNDARRCHAEAFFCLGDIGIDSCIDLVRGCGAATVFGNWEVSNWRHLAIPQNQHWMLALPPMLRRTDMWLTHAAPFWSPVIQTLADLNSGSHLRFGHKFFPYLDFEEDYLWQTIAALTESDQPLMFHGHTHRQMVWRFTPANQLLQEFGPVVQLTAGETYVVGVGSVGRPTDGPGACYVIFDDTARTLEFRRIRPK